MKYYRAFLLCIANVMLLGSIVYGQMMLSSKNSTTPTPMMEQHVPIRVLEYDVEETPATTYDKKTPFAAVCKIMKKGMKFTFESVHAVQCDCDESKWIVDCTVRSWKVKQCLEEKEYGPCTANISASFKQFGGEDSWPTLSSFQLCVEYAAESTGPQGACATFHYSNGGSIPDNCDVVFAVNGKGLQTCKTCYACGRNAFTVNCANVLPRLQSSSCEIFDDPEKDFFAHLLEKNQRPQTTDADDDGENGKSSKSVGGHHYPLVAVWLVTFAPFFLQ